MSPAPEAPPARVEVRGERLHALDGLRAVAAMLVVSHHLGVANGAQALRARGWEFLGNLLGSFTASGVELFFVLSAIVLARPYVRGGRPMNLQRYGVRRLQRLLPPYLAAWLLAGLAIGLASRFPTWWTMTASLPTFSIGTWLSQVAIVYLGRDVYNFAWWSLTTEVSFYLLLPALVPAFRRIGSAGLRVAFGLSLLIGLFLAPRLAELDLLRNLALYASCFCAGLCLAKEVPTTAVCTRLVVAGVVWVLASGRYPPLNVHIGWGLVYFGLVAAAMDHRTTLSRALSSYGFVWLGERSYSIFLVHYSIIGLVSHAASYAFDHKSVAYVVATRVSSVLLSMTVAVLVFQTVERRFARNLQTANDVLPLPSRGFRIDGDAHG